MQKSGTKMNAQGDPSENFSQFVKNGFLCDPTPILKWVIINAYMKGIL